jgi:endonuclease/exonuclease/phosphatase family metal-dependent hydrolase
VIRKLLPASIRPCRYPWLLDSSSYQTSVFWSFAFAAVIVVGSISRSLRWPSSSPDCRVVSYNVLYAGLGPEGHDWTDRRRAVVAELDRLSPDVVAFQGVWMAQVDDLQASLPAFSWVTATETPAHTPIAYRSDQFELIEADTFWLSPPGTVSGAPAWDAAFQRLATYATLDDRTTDTTVTVLSVHLDHEGNRARREGVTLIRDRLDDVAADSEVVVAGDFNCRPGDPAHARATAEHESWQPLADAASVAAETGGPAAIYTGFDIEQMDPQNIDHVFVSDGIDVERVVTCVSPVAPNRRPSDHRPVLADLSWDRSQNTRSPRRRYR